MTTSVPDVIARYFRVIGERDVDAFVACFADNATVADEDRLHEGRAAIRAWRERTAAEYDYDAVPEDFVEEAGGSFVVTAQVTGTFPGSPIRLRHRFTLRDGLIGALDIRP
ncbi:nuclear transport factor 2 family protein [Micromonospora thermarum]|uniref:Nuclear transport factor 2 family protein n=1 Tax=Micromonospora thermarum TaxID=2720024 RepID=A0ABX0Z4V0_9ACTN|nr:nuclear transport factor 2 family protein [Micromonospora thermarum]NJP30995.1 nuclear transport factor 2 family protein [Micromonospora thermarum]